MLARNPMRFILLTLLTVIGTSFFGAAQEEAMPFASDVVKWKYRVEDAKDGEATLVIEASILKGWEIGPLYLPSGATALPTTVTLTKSKSYQAIGKMTESKPHKEYDDILDEELIYHVNKAIFKQRIKVLSKEDFTVAVDFGYQTCKINATCLPPYSGKGSIKVKGDPNAGESAATAVEDTTTTATNTKDNKTTAAAQSEPKKDTKAPKAGKEKDGIKNMSLWTIFFLAFISGLAALMTPCVFPMIPMTVSFFTKRSKSRAAGIRNALIYSISIIVIYILLGTVVTAVFGADVLNNMSTNPWFNIIFFLILVVFAISFMGAFEIRLPASWANKADSKADKGGIIGIFFMALALAIISFSCTGPIVGELLVISSREGGVAPLVGMFGFSLALAMPFGLFAAFPGWMNSLPKSGGWLNTVKVVLGLLELALAFKFLSNADLALQAHWLEREVFLSIWIAVFGVLALYLLGFIQFPHDDKVDKISVGRGMLGMTVLAFVIYMIPGLWGAPLNLISAFPPPPSYSESPMGVGGSGKAAVTGETNEDMHLGPQNIMVFHDYDKAKAYADKVGKPLFVDFTGHNCVNCRKMELSVWNQPGIIDYLKNDVVIASLHIDERVDLPKEEQKMVEIRPGEKKKLMTTGDKWFTKEIVEFKSATQPLYVMIGPNGEHLENGKADYEHHRDPADFKAWLEKGLKAYKKLK